MEILSARANHVTVHVKEGAWKGWFTWAKETIKDTSEPIRSRTLWIHELHLWNRATSFTPHRTYVLSSFFKVEMIEDASKVIMMEMMWV